MSAVGLILLIGGWQLVNGLKLIDPSILSSPSDVVRTFWSMTTSGVLGADVASSARLYGVGFGLSLVTGLIIGVVLGWYQRINAVFDSWVSVFYAAPRIALIPLIIAWAGLGLRAQVIFVWTIAVFPIIINVVAGINATSRDYISVARSFLATNREILWTVAVPGAAPYVFAGIRQGLILALTGVIVAEFFVGGDGLGGMILNAAQQFQMSEAFVGVVIFAVSAILLTAILRLLERLYVKWQ